MDSLRFYLLQSNEEIGVKDPLTQEIGVKGDRGQKEIGRGEGDSLL